MNLNKVIPPRILKAMPVLWAVVVLWLYVGNLVNFHQHHIFGKQLIPAACYSSRSKEKAQGAFASKDNTVSFHAGLQFDFTVPARSLCLCALPAAAPLHFIIVAPPLTGSPGNSCSLRGPPAAFQA